MNEEEGAIFKTLQNARSDALRMVRLFNRLEAAVSHHKKGHEALFVEDPDAALWNARDKILKDFHEGKG